VVLCGVFPALPALPALLKIPQPVHKPPPGALFDPGHLPHPLVKPPSGAAHGPREPAFFKIATGTTAGTYFPIGEALAAIISHPIGSVRCEETPRCGPEGMLAVAQTSDGSMRNVAAVEDGRVASALAQADLVDAAYRGRPPFRAGKEMTNLRVIASLYPEAVHLIVRKGSVIKDDAELRGKRVAVGLPGSGTQPTALTVMQAVGLSRRSVKLREVGIYDAADLLRSNDIDAFFFVGGAPVALIHDLYARGEISLISLIGPAFDALRARQPLFQKLIIPALTYASPEDVQTLSVNALWIVSATISDKRVYEITKALWSAGNRKVLENSHELGRHITLESALDGVPIPLHPGAERYYREVGLFDAPTLANGEDKDLLQNPPNGRPVKAGE